MLANSETATAKSFSTRLCYYSNSTSQIQIIRVTHISNCYFEKVVFPNQRLLFEAIPEVKLEIYISQGGNKKLAQLISCQNLQVYQIQPSKSDLQAVSA